MVHAAFEWDHVAGSHYIRWVVIQCAGIGELFGGIQALAPRVDVAYFIDRKTAESDAKSFATFKNEKQTRALGGVDLPIDQERLEAFPWDHAEARDLIRWAVLKHSPLESGSKRVRQDVAYFLNAATAEADSKWFAAYRNAALLEPQR